MKWLVIFLLFSTVAVAQTIADYPYFFFIERDFQAYIIKGDLRAPEENSASNLVLNEIPKMYAPTYRIHDGYNFFRIRADPLTIPQNVRFASEVLILDRPAIIVGTPCNNDWVRRVLEFENCNVLPADQGLILLGKYQEQPVLVITGGSPEMVLSASSWLHSDAHYRYFGRWARIRQSTGGFSAMKIGNGDLLSIGQPLGQVTPVITVGSYQSKGTTSNSYLRLPLGKVVFGKGR